MEYPQLETARRMINASICAYQIHESGWEPGSGKQPPVHRSIACPKDTCFYNVVPDYQDKVGFIDSANSGYAPEFFATGPDKINAGLVGVMADGNIVLALRGTIPPSLENNDLVEWIKDWAQDADIPPTRWSTSKALGTNVDKDTKRKKRKKQGKVEAGFSDAIFSLWPSIKYCIDKTIKNHDCTGVIVTGHSKGAALTFLAATLIEDCYPQFSGKIQVHAFAAPVVGDERFRRRYVEKGLDAASHRYQVQNDLVPFAPLWREANIFEAIHFAKESDEVKWVIFAGVITIATKGGYDAMGDFTYFNRSHQLQPGAQVQQSALPDVARTIMAGDIMTVARAHSAVDSYLPCFQKTP